MSEGIIWNAADGIVVKRKTNQRWREGDVFDRAASESVPGEIQFLERRVDRLEGSVVDVKHTIVLYTQSSQSMGKKSSLYLGDLVGLWMIRKSR